MLKLTTIGPFFIVVFSKDALLSHTCLVEIVYFFSVQNFRGSPCPSIKISLLL